jgi:hypothetical protein
MTALQTVSVEHIVVRDATPHTSIPHVRSASVASLGVWLAAWRTARQAEDAYSAALRRTRSHGAAADAARDLLTRS